MFDRMLSTQPSRTLFAQRCMLALVMAPHGAQKALGLFGGYGMRATMAYFTGTLGIPAPLAFLVIIAESVGALALLFGAATRVAAFGITAVMVGAVLTSHLSVGFFMNWFGTQNGEGFEYHLLALALAIPLIVRGGGSFAIDRMLAAKLGHRTTGAAILSAPVA